MPGRDLLRLLRRLRKTDRRGAAPSPRRTQPPPMAPASGRVRVSYAPRADGRADPGEVVWTWVPFEHDPTQGKDRPVLVVGQRGPWLAALELTSKAPGMGPNRAYVDVGTGAWDSLGRPSQVRLDRLLDVDPARVRREGAAFDPVLFQRVLAAAAKFLPELNG